jgi:hypothetical protein
MATTPRPAAPQSNSDAYDGRITNGGKGIAYLRDYYLPALLNEQLQPVGSPGA